MKNLILLTVVLMVALSTLYAGEITERAAKPQDIFQLREELAYAAGHKMLGSAGISSATVYLVVANTPVAVVNNAFVTLTASNTIAFSTGHISLGNSEMCYFSLGVNAAGAYSTVQGPIVTNANDLVVPKFATGVTPLANIKVVCAAAGTFVPNTTSVAAPSNVTITLTNVHSLPISLNMHPR